MKKIHKANVIVIADKPINFKRTIYMLACNDEIRLEYQDKYAYIAQEYLLAFKKLGLEVKDIGKEDRQLPAKEGGTYKAICNFVVLKKVPFLKNWLLSRDEELQLKISKEAGDREDAG